MRDSHKGKETLKSTPSKQRKPNQTNNSLQKAVEPESHAKVFNQAPVIACKKCEQAINKRLSVKCCLCVDHFCRSCTKIDKVMLLVPIKVFRGLFESCQTVPGVQKLLVRIGIIEARQDEPEYRVQKIDKSVLAFDNVKNDQGRNSWGEGDRK